MDKNLFMMCRVLNPQAMTELSKEYHIRKCRRDELDVWKNMPFDDPEVAEKYSGFMQKYFEDVYSDKENLFFQKCLFVCDKDDVPIGTCFAWSSYDKITSTLVSGKSASKCVEK